MGFEPHRAEVVSRSQVHIGVQGGGQAPQQGDGGLGAAFFDALDLAGVMPARPARSATLRPRGAALVIDGL